MHDILISGSMAYDRIMRFAGHFKDHILPDEIDHISVSFTAESLSESFGGTAGNIAYNLALLGEKPKILAAVGNDFDAYDAWLKKCGITTDSLQVEHDIKTAAAHIVTDAGNSQIAAFYPGALTRAYMSPVDLDTAALAIVAPSSPHDMNELTKFYRSKGMRYFFDPGQQLVMFSKEDLIDCINGAEVLFANEYEMDLISEKTNLSREQINERVPTLIVTRAAEGSIIIKERTQTKIPAIKIDNAVDPTGAGDAHRAGFIKGIRLGLPLEVCVRLANTVATYCVEKEGTQNHKFTLTELKERYKGAYGETLAL